MGNTGIIMTIFLFYTVIFVILGMIGRGDYENQICGNLTNDLAYNAKNQCVNAYGGSTLTGVVQSVRVFLAGIFFSLGSIPWWANMILFLPLTLAIIWAILELVATAIP